MSQKIIKIHWHGPFEQEDIPDAEKEIGPAGLYLLAGKTAGQRGKAEIHYIGITEGCFSTRLSNHHKLHKITRESQIWLGSVEFPIRQDRRSLELAESVLVYHQQPKLNERKKENAPEPAIVISHWFNPHQEARINQTSTTRSLPDVICWDGELWRTGNLLVSDEAA